MKVTDLQLKNRNNREMIAVTLSDDVEHGHEVVLLERCTSGVWVNHRRSYTFERLEDNTFVVDVNKILKQDIQFNELVVFDIKLKDCENNTMSSVKTDLSADNVAKRKTTTFGVYGKSTWDFYRNNSGAISIRLKMMTDKKVFARYVLQTDDTIEFVIDNFDNKAKYYFARQTDNGFINFDAKVPLSSNASGTFVLNKKELLAQIRSGCESWRLIEILNKRVICLSHEEIVDRTNIQLNEVYSLNFSTEKDVFKCVVNEAYDESYERIKVWVIGSCYSRLIFRSLDFYNKDYKKLYNPVTTIYHMSIPSIVSGKIPYDENDFVGVHQKDLNHYARDNFEKDVFERLAEETPDYVIMDNYSSVTNRLVETEDGCYIDENFYLSDCKAFQDLSTKAVYDNVSDEFFNIYKDSLEVFKEKLEKILPLNRVILIKANPALKKSENGVVTDWPDSQTIKTRRYLWNKFDNYFISKMPGVRIVDMRNEKYISEKSPVQQFQSNHLNSAFYQDAFAKINEIILLDKIKNN